MKTENSVLMQQARESLRGKWGIAIGGFVLYQVILIAIQKIPNAGPLISFIVSAPFGLGITMFALALSRGQEVKIEKIFDGFKNFTTAFTASLLYFVFVLLWTLLLIVPGIIAGLSYSMIFFIITDEPQISASEALKKSKKMMDGYKWKLFKLHLRFVGWGLLCLLTLGIGFLWLIPYAQVSLAKFYDDLKNSEKNSVPPSTPTPEPVPIATI